MSDKISNTLKSTLGGAKESLGKAVGSEQLMASGHAEKAQADARTVAQRAQQEQEMAGQRVQGAADEVTGRTKSTLGAAAGNTKMQVEGNLQETSGTARKTMNK
ncbi:hypothetical protein CPC16_007992 [Podila verticillata]|nr:hypothetical protein BGZ52_006651 [Haplosporangium bisporale]KAF9213672.1 hypothetical protein BGZ59_005010 [Podila verticillata]KAF9385399.1 hypothetical protein CPC16_007992 [Podila verticillata]KFH67392.1 hypothetical protein MVEG_06125 [Podila verticillata NRRL 6337]